MFKIWNLEEKRKEFSLKAHAFSISSVAISQDGKFFVTASRDKTIKVWNLEEKREEFTLNGHTSYIFSAVISQDGKYLTQ